MRRLLLVAAAFLLVAAAGVAKTKKQVETNPLGDGASDRAYWAELAYIFSVSTTA